MAKNLPSTERTLPLLGFAQRQGAAIANYFDRADNAVPYSEEMVNPSRPLRIGGAIILFTFFGCGLWAATARLDSAAVAPGVVVVESNRRVVQHLEGGIVRDILVEDGSRVKAGDVLVVMDDTRAHAQLDIYENELYSNLAIQARLEAERDNRGSVSFPPELAARTGDPRIAGILAAQETVFHARKTAMDGQKSILDQRIQQYREQIVGLHALQKSKEVQEATIHDELSGLTGLLEDGYVTKSRVLALQREAARLQGETGDHISAVARSEQGIGEARLQIFQLEKTRQEEIAKELRDIQAKIAESRARLVAAEDVMHRIDVTSPVAGTVLNLQLHTKGGVVPPGASMMEIVPDSDALVLDVSINPMDIDTVHPGQEVDVHISAVDTRLTPVIHGTLTSLSADRLVDPHTGVPYYKGRVSIAADQLNRLGEHKLHSGMAVEALIKRGEQTVLSYVMKPLSESLTRSFREK
jgi:HlyD family type I secretion membrane fusion protein